MTSYRGVEAVDWFGFSRLWSLPVGYAITTSRIDSLNRTKTLNESLATAGLFFCKGDGGMSSDILYEAALAWKKERICVSTSETVILYDRLTGQE